MKIEKRKRRIQDQMCEQKSKKLRRKTVWQKKKIVTRYMSLPGSHNRRTEKAEEVKSSKKKEWKKNQFFSGQNFIPLQRLSKFQKKIPTCFKWSLVSFEIL